MKKVLSLALVLMLAFSLCAVAFAENSALPPSGLGSLTIYKYGVDDSDSPSLSDSTGTSADAGNLPADARPLAGVEFTITLVDETGAAITGANAFTDSDVTDASGMVSFSDLVFGRYHVVETAIEGANSVPLDFYVDVPMTNVDGDGWIQDVVLYPKNELVSGAVIFEKVDEAGDPVEGATFSLLRANADPAVWGSATVVQTGLQTGADGKIVVNDLYRGTYAFVETAVAPASDMALDSTPQMFVIDASGSVALDGTESGTVVKLNASGDDLQLVNYDLPDIDKTIDLDDPATIHVGDDVKFSITVSVPSDIARYTEFFVTDQLQSAQLSYRNDSLKVYGVAAGEDDALIAASNYDLTVSNGGRIVVAFIDKDNGEGINHLSAIQGFDSLRIEFLATINNINSTIENIASIDYNNDAGADGQKSTDPDPDDPNDPVIKEAGDITLVKHERGDQTKLLPGAEFSIYATEADALAGENALEVTGATNASGQLVISDLVFSGEERTLWLVETQAPTGYKLMTAPMQITIDENDQTIYVANDKSSIINDLGELLIPKTGGVGTALFTLLGLTMVVGGTTVVSVKNKRKNSDEG